ncbi:MAG: hypothetical protein ACJAS1_002413 [Oleiphilaceae bacterium]|jgi:hypothetical protein
MTTVAEAQHTQSINHGAAFKMGNKILDKWECYFKQFFGKSVPSPIWKSQRTNCDAQWIALVVIVQTSLHNSAGIGD